MRVRKDSQTYSVSPLSVPTLYGFSGITGSRAETSMSFINKLPHSRLSLRDWLKVHADREDGVTYFDGNKNLIKIPWVHASKKNWDQSQHCKLFEDWAKYKGKQERSAKQWKTNFRCALNSRSDIREIKELSKKNGADGFKVFQIDENKVKSNRKSVLKKKPSITSFQTLDSSGDTTSPSPTPSQDSVLTNDVTQDDYFLKVIPLDYDIPIEQNFDFQCFSYYDLLNSHTEEVESTVSNTPSSSRDPLGRIPVTVMEMVVDDDSDYVPKLPKSRKKKP